MPRRAGFARLLMAALFAAACSDAAGPAPKRPGAGGPLFSFSPNGIGQSGTANGALGETGDSLAKGFDPKNPHHGDAVIATVFWLGQINIVDSVVDFVASTPNTRVGNTYHQIDYVTAGGYSMATFVATNIQNFPDSSSVSGQILAVRAFMHQRVVDGGIKISAWSGIEDNFAAALRDVAHASGTDTGGNIPAHTRPIAVNAGGIVYTATMGALDTTGAMLFTGVSAPGTPFGRLHCVGGFDCGRSSDKYILEDAEYAVLASAGTVDPQWTWMYGGTAARPWLVTTFSLNAAPPPNSPPPPPPPPPATHVAFTTQPQTTQAGQTIPAMQVSALDDAGNVVTGFTGSITVALGANPGGGTLAGTTSVNAVSGVATFSTLSINNAGNGYTLTASASGLTGATSASFNITAAPPPPATHVAFTTQPQTTQAGQTIPAMQVSALDDAGNVVTGFAGSIIVALGANPGGGTLAGTTSVNAVSGVATFSTLSINNAGNGYTLTASASGLTGATSASFNITAAPPPPATHVAFTTQPQTTQAAQTMPAVRVSALDDAGNVVTGFTGSITVALGANPGGGTLAGTTSVTAVSGVATFSTLSINNAGTGYTLVGSASGLTGATSTAFNITAAPPPPATHVAFTTQPQTTQAGQTMSAVRVAALDDAGNIVTGYTGLVTVALGANPGGGTLAGTTSVNAVSGVATFSTLSINNAGNGYTLTASASGLTGATSASFNITAAPPPPATHVAFTTQPQTTQAGQTMSAVRVAALDDAGNIVTGYTGLVTVALGANPGGGTLAGTTSVNAVSGVATFSTLSINNAGNGYTLTASASGLTGATSSSFNITAPPATNLAFTTQPQTTQAGQTMPVVRVTARDASGNTVTSYTGLITVAIGTNPGGGTLSGTTSVNAVSGVATFSTLSINNAGNGYTLTASASGLTGATSSSFNITVPPATNLAFTTQPQTTVAGQTMPAVRVTARDASGNTVTSYTGLITIAIGTNPGGGTLAGTTSVNAVGGVATFSTLSINNAGNGYTLTASASGLTGATSTSFNITALRRSRRRPRPARRCRQYESPRVTRQGTR